MREIWDYIVIGAGPAGSVFCAKAAASLRILRLDGSYARLYEQQQLELQLQAEKEALHAED